MFRTLKNCLGEHLNNTLPEFCDNDDDVDNGCAGGNYNGRDDVAKETDGVGGVVWSASLPSWCSSWMETHWRMALDGIITLSTWPTMIWSIPPSVTFSSLSLCYGGETHQPASLPSWCPSWMETNWRMALEGITTLSTWVETTGRMTIKLFTALITFFLSCIVTWCFTWFHLLRRGRGYMKAIFFFGLLSECYVIWFEINRIEIWTVRCWTRAFAVVTWILSFNDGWLFVFLVTCFTATNSLPRFLKKLGDWIEGDPPTNTRDLHVHITNNTTNVFTPPREHGQTKLEDDQSPRYSRVCPSTRFKDDIGLGGENLQLGSSSSSRRDRLIELGEGKNIKSLIGIDDECNSEIISKEDENDQFMLSPRHIKNHKAWQRIIAKQAADVAFDGECVRVNRGGAIFLVEGLRAFLPGSHLMGRLPDDDLVGQTLPLKFLEVSQEENKLVVSNRRAVVETQTEDLSRGDVIEGVVKALKPYGAYVEMGGMSGLLHISQISMYHIANIERVLQPGQRVKCMIIDHNKVNGRTKLSTKTLEPEPGDMITDPARVYAQAEDTARMYLEKQEAKPREVGGRSRTGRCVGRHGRRHGRRQREKGGDDASDNLDFQLH